MSERRDMSGAVFKVLEKQKDTFPDYEGNCTIAGVDYWMNAWIKKDKNGKPYMSFAFKPKKLQANHPQKQEAFEDSFADDWIPF